MKTNRIKWDDMWEEYFGNYGGWRFFISSNSSEKKYGNKDDILSNEAEILSYKYEPAKELNSVDVILQDNSQDKAVQCSISDFLRPPDNQTGEKFYPVDEYMGSLCDQTPVTETLDEKPDITAQTNPTEFCEKIKEQNTDNNAAERENNIANPKDIIFECSTGQGYAFTTPSHNPIICTPHINSLPKTLGLVSIDTSSIKKAKIRVMFSCNICFIPKKDSKGTAQLEFVLYRSCNAGHESHVGNWVYDIIDSNEDFCQSFKLSFFSCNFYPGHYNFIVRVIPVYIKSCSVCITNCHLSAVSQ